MCKSNVFHSINGLKRYLPAEDISCLLPVTVTAFPKYNI